MSGEDHSTGQTSQFLTVKRTILLLELKKIEYEDLKFDRKDPLIDFMMRMRAADKGPMGSSLFCFELFNTLGGNPGAVVGIINDLYARGVEFTPGERVSFVIWLAELERTLDATTFTYIFQHLPAALTEYFKLGKERMARGIKTGLSGNESKTA